MYFDIPLIHSYNTVEGFEFIEALKGVQNVQIFSHKSIQMLIDFQWKYWRLVNQAAMGGPLVVQVPLYWLWSNILVVNKDDKSTTVFRYFTEIALVILCLYFVIIQLTILIGG